MYIQSGIGNLGTESVSDVHRVAAEMMGMPWEKCESPGATPAKNLPWSCVSGGSQTTHAHTRAAHAAATDAIKKLQEIAAKTLGGKPEDYEVAERARVRAAARSMTLAQAAQKAIELGGKFDGHELPKDINAFTKTLGGGAGRPGPDGRRARQLPARRRHATRSSPASPKSKSTSRPASTSILDYLAVADVGTVIHPHALGGQVLGRSMLGIGHALGQKWVYDQHYGVPLAKRFYQNRPPTILDVPPNMTVGGGRHPRSGDAGRRARHRRAAGRRRLLRGPERALRRGRRRDLPPRAGQRRHDSDVARSGQAGVEGLTAHI